ncbi:MAG: septal ring lytic transglycosylase RlpA family protein [Desulfobacteraceae bacterium]|nr:septal ring lytic transglycosylase RlpA family protein [Desulfobacteraceae bacterium]
MAKPAIRIYALPAVLFALAAILVFSGCHTAPPKKDTPYKSKSYKINGQWYHPITDSQGFRQTGFASWYGAKFHGRRTANGETYNMHAKTAAHKTLPMGTFMLVRNNDNGKETVVRINDRGPFVRGRIIDLSYRAAKDIGMIGPGTATVEIIAMEKGYAESPGGDDGGRDFFRGDFTVQVGAFANHAFAVRLKNRLLKHYDHVAITPFEKGGQTLYRVRVGRFSSLETAEKTEDRLIEYGHKNAFAVACDDG